MPPKAQGGADVANATTGTIQTASAFQLLVRKMASMAVLDSTSATRDSGEDINRILEAETEQEMWDADELAKWNAQKLSGCDIQIVGFQVQFSPDSDSDIKTPYIDPETHRQMFLLVDSFRITNNGNTKEYNLPEPGELFTWNTSARAIVPKLFWMLAHGWFDDGAKPVRLRIVGTPLAGGKSVEKLKPLPDGVVITATSPITDIPLAEEPPF